MCNWGKGGVKDRIETISIKNNEQLGIRSSTEVDLHAVLFIWMTGDGTRKIVKYSSDRPSAFPCANDFWIAFMISGQDLFRLIR